MSQDEFNIEEPCQSLKELKAIAEDKNVRVRGFLYQARATGKCAFTVLRQGVDTLQCVYFGQKDMIRYINSVPRESFVEIWGKFQKAEQDVQGCSIKSKELQIERFFAITRAPQTLPLQVEDAARPDSAFNQPDNKYVNPGRDTRLDFRVLDLRTPANQSIFRVRMAIQQAFCAFLTQEGFM